MFGNPFARQAPPPGPSTLLFVCTGNICRSPLAEKVLRSRLNADAAAPRFQVMSAGLHAVVGSPMDTIPATIAARAGADPEHAGTQISRSHVEVSSLIITMTRDQLDELVLEYPIAMKRTFTLTEIVRILEELPSEVPAPGSAPSRTIFDVATDASRSRSLLTKRGTIDVEDPFRRSLATHERVGAQIIDLTNRLADALTSSPSYGN
ncbi:hypothetical protein [Herbiconiux sp. SALV-R1]|uniref:arsenate reductase/protein-tyrosine-phosphatase family protein n=1 Tax=unclassified Herbiconiux TaxID=2618217 RepID=UPI00352C5327